MATNIIEDRGYFWWREEPIPQGHYAPNACVGGVLTIDSTGQIRLDLDNVLSVGKREHRNAGQPDKHADVPKIIQGILKTSDQYVLLIDVFEDGSQASSNGISYESYSADSCLVGRGAFPSTRKLPRFGSIEVNLAGYEEWLRLGSIVLAETKTTTTAKYKKRRSFSYPLDDGQLTLRFDISKRRRGMHHTHELVLRESMTLKLQTKRSMSLDQAHTEYRFLQDLFVLLTDSHYALAWPTVRPTGAKRSYTLYFTRESNSTEAPSRHRCPTNFVDLQPKFGEIFNAWRTKRALFGAAFYSYLSTRRETKLYVENRFTNLTSGMEAFHRAKFPAPDMPSKLDEKIRRILGQITAEKDRRWLARILEHQGEPRLEQRIFEILRDLPLNLDEDRLRRFATVCAGRRNEIAHFGGERQPGNRVEFIVDLDKQSDALAFFYYMTLLREIGVSDETLCWWLYHSFRSYQLKFILVQCNLLDKSVLEHSAEIPAPPGVGSH